MEWYWYELFWSAAAIGFYTHAGYPLLMLLAGMFRRQRPGQACHPRVSLVIPAHNEAKVLRQKLQNALALDYPRERLEIIVASDGSQDETIDIARSFSKQGVRLLAFAQRRGKASVLNDAVAQSTGTVICLCDANVMFRPDALRHLVAQLDDSRVGAVTGEVRLASEDSNFGQGESFYYRIERTIQLAESQVGSLMGVDGGMYVLRRELFRPLPADTILDDFVISMNVIRQGKRVAYEPAALADENATPLAVQEYRRRVRVSAGAVQSLKRGNFPPIVQPVVCWQYFSHKLLRWMGPLVLVAALVSNAMLWPAGIIYQAAFVGQVLFYAAAAVGTVSLKLR